MQEHLTPEHYWAAGFIEGEGSFGVTGSKVLQVTVCQKQRQPLDRLQAVIGGNIYRIQWQGRKYWRLSLCGNRRTEPVMLWLRPLMSPRRQWQIDKALAARIVRDPNGVGSGNRNKTHCPQGHPYDVFKTEKGGGQHRKCSICTRAAEAKRRERLKRDPEWQAKQREYRRRYRVKKAQA